MDESRDTSHTAGVAHAQNATRKKNIVAEHKQARVATGGVEGSSKLDLYAGTQYVRITSETVLLDAIKQYGGQNMHNDGAPPLVYEELPACVMNTRISADRGGTGGRLCLCPEYVFNAKRSKAFRAGQMDFENQPLDVHPDMNDPSKYFDDNGFFTLTEADRQVGGFFLMTDPAATNIFDLPLPRPVYGSVRVGSRLLDLFVERERGVVSRAAVQDRFNAAMHDRDVDQMQTEVNFHETAVSYDTVDVTEAERRNMRYNMNGSRHSSECVIEPVQYLDGVQTTTNRIIERLLMPWKHEEETKLKRMNAAWQEEGGASSDAQQEFEEAQAAFYQRYRDVMDDVITYHAARIESGFLNKMDRDTVPAGYVAMYDGLQTELLKTPNRTASIAWAHNSQLTADDTTTFAHIFSFVGNLFEYDAFGVQQPPPVRRNAVSLSALCVRSGRPRPASYGRRLLALLRAVRQRDIRAAAVRLQGVLWPLHTHHHITSTALDL
jgi:hypothetical protein